MKGTFFSADFAKDSNGNLRLLEINTDTSIVGNELSNFNFTEFAEILTTNDIAELHITYKPVFHNEIVSAISTAITTSIPSLADNIVLHPEDLNTIYPESIEDSDDKFILRLAYDESALFDSVYCKSTLELLSLFDSSDSTDSGSFVVSHYYSGSDSITNTLESTINPSNIPDVAIKDITEVYNPISFYKIGSTVENESNEDRWNSFVEEIKGDDKLILQYHYNTSNTDDNGHITSVRSFQIVYGSDLSVVTLHSYKISSIFELPADISSEVDTTRYINKLSDIHYYEFATNFIKAGLLTIAVAVGVTLISCKKEVETPKIPGIDLTKMDPTLSAQVYNLKENEVSQVFSDRDYTGKTSFKILTVTSRQSEHAADFVADYEKIQELALKEKQIKAIETWQNKKIKDTYISVNGDYLDCEFASNWLKK